MRTMVIDTDGGTDDAVALWWALTDPGVELAAVLVTWGNVDRETAAANVCRILHAAGRPDVPVALGAKGPTGPTPIDGLARYVHGEDGLGGHAHRWPAGDVVPVDESAPELLARLTAERPGEIDLVAIGPLSTAATALEHDPALAARSRSLTVMGGVVRGAGNVLPLREANVAHDPEAASTVVTAGWPEPPLLVGLDATFQALLHQEDIDLAASCGTVAGEFLAKPLRAYAGFYARSKQAADGCLVCHDLLATLAVLEPEVITESVVAPLAVDTGGSAAWGATIADLRHRDNAASQESGLPEGFAPWRLAMGADADRFRAAFRRLVLSR